ncbi:hypothetical protein J1605_006897 [Eschrichtius robustus]|uniref:Zinc finger CCCH domain-containing protein 18 n=1 Tax=Eschrichtius robustus TaxID=9764 RepID=A0AB34H3C9_ESCRO|nr:hypothetical protein J1605_006897 [Eschrichtius robustus]
MLSVGEKLLKKPAPPPAPPQAPKTTAPAPEPAKPGDLREARRRERQARSPPRRRTVSGSGSGSSYSGSSSRSRSLSRLPGPSPVSICLCPPGRVQGAPGEAASANSTVTCEHEGLATATSLSVSSVSSVSSATSSSSSAHSVDSDDMYADLASPVSSASSRSPTPAQAKKEKGKSKKEDGVKADKRKRDPSTQPPKPSRTPAGGRSSQQPTTPQQAPPGQPPPAAFIAHKEIKLTLLNKRLEGRSPTPGVEASRPWALPPSGPRGAGAPEECLQRRRAGGRLPQGLVLLTHTASFQAADKGSRKRYEPSDKDRQSPPPAKRANLSPDRGSRDRKSGGRLSSPKPERQRGQNSKAPAAPTDRKRPLSPQSKSSSKVTSVPGKASDSSAAAGASTGTKSGKASTLSRREELLKQLKAVEDAIARKRAKIPGKV